MRVRLRLRARARARARARLRGRARARVRTAVLPSVGPTAGRTRMPCTPLRTQLGAISRTSVKLVLLRLHPSTCRAL
jgi:hypothetical protein